MLTYSERRTRLTLMVKSIRLTLIGSCTRLRLNLAKRRRRLNLARRYADKTLVGRHDLLTLEGRRNRTRLVPVTRHAMFTLVKILPNLFRHERTSNDKFRRVDSVEKVGPTAELILSQNVHRTL